MEDKTMIQQEIISLENKLRQYIKKKNGLINENEELNSFIKCLENQIKNIRLKIEKALEFFNRKSIAIRENNKFKSIYKEKVKGILHGQYAENGLEELKSAISKSKRRIINNENEIDNCKRMINSLNEQLRLLKKELNSKE